MLLVEYAWLVMRARWSLADAALRLVPGALMLLALKAALVGAWWGWIAGPLLLSFPVHLADLARSDLRLKRWGRARRRTPPRAAAVRIASGDRR